jgi:hypothetical protein
VLRHVRTTTASSVPNQAGTACGLDAPSTSALDGRECSALLPGRFTLPLGKEPRYSLDGRLCGRQIWTLWRRKTASCVCMSTDRAFSTQSQTHFTADSQSVSQYVLVSSPLCGRLTRYCFLFKCLGLEFAVLSLWGVLSDERPSQSHFTVDSQSVSQYVLVSSPLCGRLSKYCFLFKCLGLEFVVLSLWGVLSDERPSQSHFTADCQSVSQYA